MIFRKSIDPLCLYCVHSKALDEEQMFCIKTGIVTPDHHCRRFTYDPLKRIPPEQAVLDFSKFSDEDFTL